MVSAAVLSGTYPEGGKRLTELYESLGDNDSDRELAAYIKFRQMTADYAMEMQQPKADHLKIQEKWIGDLEGFVEDYPQSRESAEAMLQLAMNQRVCRRRRGSKNLVRPKITEEFPQSSQGTKAAGAHRRLESEGQTPATPRKVPNRKRDQPRPICRNARPHPILGQLVSAV